MNDEVLALIIHELAHQFGHHTEMKYHEAICELGARLTMIALKEPSFFDEFKGS
ncbi:MAG: hypothetical protein MUP55_04910 [Candidatus Aenigmarchaeota archaeon]|nr:hypothetical protein [Candidatus Aenigmarchaeota archaeon]